MFEVPLQGSVGYGVISGVNIIMDPYSSVDGHLYKLFDCDGVPGSSN